MNENQTYLYEIKDCFLTQTEMNYIGALINCLPHGYHIQPQIGLTTIIRRTDNAKYQNELNRYVDACIFDNNYHPIAVIEINDSTHLNKDRKERDEKVKKICEEAGLPIVTFWTSYGINHEYMTKRLIDAIEKSKNPVRVRHSAPKDIQAEPAQTEIQPSIPNIVTEQKNEPTYSSKHKIVAIILSVIFGFFGVPYYYAGRTELGIIASIPFILYFVINSNFIPLSETISSTISTFLVTLMLCVNVASVIFFTIGLIKDKNGKIIK